LASRLYAGLRWLDEQKLDLIIAPLPPAEGLGGAIGERLLQASLIRTAKYQRADR
jgi:hypothetical protein